MNFLNVTMIRFILFKMIEAVKKKELKTLTAKNAMD